MHVCRFEQVADHHLGPGGPQGRRALVVAVDHGADGEPRSRRRFVTSRPRR
jgi:hypothetical protein